VHPEHRASSGGDAERIAVIGGSAAGLFTARLLASRGLGVRIYEGAGALRPIPRTLIVTSRMRELLGRAADASIVNEIRQFELFTDGRAATIPLEDPDLVIERSTLIGTLAREAQDAGAELLLGRRLEHIDTSGRLLSLAFQTPSNDTERVEARTVIGADGAFSRVARAGGWPQQSTVPLVQATVQWPRDVPSDTVRVWFAPADTPYFFWLIPESPSRGVLGLIGEDGPSTRSALQRFLVKQRLQPLEFQAARIPVYTKWSPVHRRMNGGDVYLVGDAGGHVKVTTVGGIVTGFRAALGVAEAVMNGGPGPELRRLRRELDLHLLVRRVLHRFSQEDYSRLLDVIDPPTRRVLGRYNRDQMERMLLRICANPRLVLMGLRGLLLGGRVQPGTRN
jgi:geranylgeranyl diphosphate/geranylgeranyl-bacteriochlorophyllide a reductase